MSAEIGFFGVVFSYFFFLLLFSVVVCCWLLVVCCLIMDKIVYCGVFDHGICLAQVSTEGDSIVGTAQALLDKVDCSFDHRKAFSPYQGYVFQYIAENNLCYLAACHADFPLHISFSFLDKVKEEYKSNYSSSGKSSEFKEFAKKEMEFFSANPEADTLRGLKQKVSDVTDIMKDNIEKVMERGEKIEDLEDQSDILRNHAEVFHTKSRDVKCQMLKNNYRMFGIAFAVMACIIILILIMLFAGGYL